MNIELRRNSLRVAFAIDGSTHDHQLLEFRGKIRIKAERNSQVSEGTNGNQREFTRIFIGKTNQCIDSMFCLHLSVRGRYATITQPVSAMHIGGVYRAID